MAEKTINTASYEGQMLVAALEYIHKHVSKAKFDDILDVLEIQRSALFPEGPSPQISYNSNDTGVPTWE